ncbi:MAG TPA: hypothetical protein VK308_12495, partial [Pyrinomonadaceae bacterium]|nr:hypothetical protein [Pyrinomonadaceae bacterium]
MLLPNAKFCGSCGFQMQSQQPPSDAQTSQIPPFQQQYQNQAGQQQYQNQAPNYQNQAASGREAFQFDSDGRGQWR